MCGTQTINRRTKYKVFHIDLHICVFSPPEDTVTEMLELANKLFNKSGIYLHARLNKRITDTDFETVDRNRVLDASTKIRKKHAKQVGGIVISFIKGFTNGGDACGVGGWSAETLNGVVTKEEGYIFMLDTCTGWALAHEIGHALRLVHVCESAATEELPKCEKKHEKSLMYPINIADKATLPDLAANEVRKAKESKLLLPGKG